MKLNDFLSRATKKLEIAGVGTARLDILIMLEDELKKDRANILAHPEIELSKTQLKRLNAKLHRREHHLPMAYIRGFTEFYKRKFRVNRHVLEPRPESETMVDILKDLAKISGPDAKSWRIADIGTGSGAIGITVALELHNHNVDLYDIDASALAVARHNCSLHELHLRTVKRDLLKNSHKPYNVLLANLPYVPANFFMNQAAKLEPRIATYGGQDGLGVYRRLFEQLTHFSWHPKYILTEALPPQQDNLAKIAQSGGFKLFKSEDFIQVFSLV